MMRTFDLVVIGTGTAAATVAMRCRAAGWRVAIVDSRPFGGTCALRGCDPKKVLVGAAEVVDWTRRMRGRGVDGDAVRIRWPELMRFKRSFTDPVPASCERSLTDAGIAPFHGRARFVGRASVRICSARTPTRSSTSSRSRCARGCPRATSRRRSSPTRRAGPTSRTCCSARVTPLDAARRRASVGNEGGTLMRSAMRVALLAAALLFAARPGVAFHGAWGFGASRGTWGFGGGVHFGGHPVFATQFHHPFPQHGVFLAHRPFPHHGAFFFGFGHPFFFVSPRVIVVGHPFFFPPHRVFVTSPFFCFPCGVAFSTEAVFFDHLHRFHHFRHPGRVFVPAGGHAVFVGA